MNRADLRSCILSGGDVQTVLQDYSEEPQDALNYLLATVGYGGIPVRWTTLTITGDPDKDNLNSEAQVLQVLPARYNLKELRAFLYIKDKCFVLWEKQEAQWAILDPLLKLFWQELQEIPSSHWPLKTKINAITLAIAYQKSLLDKKEVDSRLIYDLDTRLVEDIMEDRIEVKAANLLEGLLILNTSLALAATTLARYQGRFKEAWSEINAFVANEVLNSSQPPTPD